MGTFSCWTLLLLLAGQCVAADVPALIAAVADTAECGQHLCFKNVPCSDVSGLASEKARGHGNHSAAVAPARPTPEKVDSAAMEILPKSSSTASSAEEGLLDVSTPPPDDEVSASTTSGKVLRRRSVGQSEEKCILVFHPDLRAQLSNDTAEVPAQRNTSWEVWLYGFLSVGFISLSGLFGVIFVPLMKKSIFSVVMRYLVGLGIGALSATSIFQLIPECFQIMDRDFLPSSVVIWMTVWVFFVFESVCKIVLNNREGHHGHSHGRSSDTGGERAVARPIYRPKNDNADSIEVDCFLPKSFENGKAAESTLMESLPVTSNTRLNKDNKMAFHHRSHDYLATTSAPVKRKSGLSSISSVAWMIIIGDGIHNFIDGVSIGAGFTQSNLTGVSISLAIIFEEFPHELGDFAILISSGMSVKKALAFNFASACTAFLGLVLGIVLESFEINSYIFGLAGGLFLYISLSDLIPQLNLMIDEALEDKELGRRNAFFIMIQQNLGILSGMGLIYVIAKFGDQITIERL